MPPPPRPARRRPTPWVVLLWAAVAVTSWVVAVLADGPLPWIAAFAAASVAVVAAFSGRRRRI